MRLFTTKILIAIYVLTWILDVKDCWEDTTSGIVCLNDNMLIEFGRLEAYSLIKVLSLMVIKIHCHVHAKAEEATP